MLDIISWKEYKTVLFKRDYVVNLEIAAWVGSISFHNITIVTNNSNKSQVCASSCLRIDGMNYLFVVWKSDGACLAITHDFVANMDHHCEFTILCVASYSVSLEIWNRLAARLLPGLRIHSRQGAWLVHCSWCWWKWSLSYWPNTQGLEFAAFRSPTIDRWDQTSECSFMVRMKMESQLVNISLFKQHPIVIYVVCILLNFDCAKN